jgi:hypothetical protein
MEAVGGDRKKKPAPKEAGKLGSPRKQSVQGDRAALETVAGYLRRQGVDL